MKEENTESSAHTTEQAMLEMMGDAETGEEFTRSSLKAHFLSSIRHLLTDARSHADLSQQQLAEMLGKSQSSIARWEANREGTISLSLSVC